MNKADRYLEVLADLQASQAHAQSALNRLLEKARRLGKDEAASTLGADLCSYKLALMAARSHCAHLEALLAEGALKADHHHVGDGTRFLQ